jgi:hypothetical protein
MNAYSTELGIHACMSHYHRNCRTALAFFDVEALRIIGFAPAKSAPNMCEAQSRCIYAVNTRAPNCKLIRRNETRCHDVRQNQPGTLARTQASNQLLRPLLREETTMQSIGRCVLAAGVAVATIGIYAERSYSGSSIPPKNAPATMAVEKGAKWLVSVQGKDGGWGQDGGETSYVRQGEHLETNGNDVANTAIAATALLHAANTPTGGQCRESLRRAVDFILAHVEQSPVEGLAITDLKGTQIQRKLGPFIDTFLTSKLLAELDGNMRDARMNARVRRNLQKCVAKIEKNQLKDGSWNLAGGWAPILGTSMASRSLFEAKQKGVPVSEMAMQRVEVYTQAAASAPPSGVAAARIGGRVGAGEGGGVGGGIGTGVAGGLISGSAGKAPSAGLPVDAASAGVPLYAKAQQLEQLSRTDGTRLGNADKIKAITKDLDRRDFVAGFGSIGGEEFFSYLNISDSLHRIGGPEWQKWNAETKTKLITLQNDDGTWAGQHCITGRVAVTSAAILLFLAENEPVTVAANAKKK